MSDPSGFVTNPPSTYVKIMNTAREEMNQTFGLVVGFSSERGRYILLLCQNGSQVMLKPENLVPASQIEKYQAQFQQMRNDPRVKQQITSLYNKAQRQLGGTKPEYVAAGLGVGVIFLIFMVGFTKVLMLTSLLLLMALIVGPDVSTFGLRNWKLIIRNFPRRCRETIEQTLPAARGKINDRIALGIVLFLFGMTIMTLVVPNGPGNTVAAPAPPSRAPLTSSIPLSVIDQAYKLGFDDAAANLPFGSVSLEALKSSITTPQTIDHIDYDYIPPSPPPRNSGSKFGFGTIMSILMIGRFVMQSGMAPEGRFDIQLAMANIQTLPIYQQGMLGYSVYNVLRVFF